MSDELVHVNKPEGGIRMEVTSETHTKWLVDAQAEQTPTPKMFRDLGVAGNKLVVLSTFLPETYEPEAMRLYRGVERLKRMLARERLRDETAVRELCMGDLTQLPEVESEREQRGHGTCPECGQPTPASETTHSGGDAE